MSRPTLRTVSNPGQDDPTSWRTLAVSRTAQPAREAAEARVQAFIDAGLDLLGDPDGAELTVQNVVDRAGLSLRSFYQHFAGKYELLLAVFEEGIRRTAFHLHQAVDASEGPLGRLETFVIEYYRLCRSGQPRHSDQRLPGRGMGQFAYQLLFDHQDEALQAFRPLVSLLVELLDDAGSAGVIQPDLDHEQVAGILLQAIMFNAFSTTITGSSTDDVPGRGELFWRVLLDGLTGPVRP